MAEAKISERGLMLLKLPAPPPVSLPFFEAGGVTFHTHRCPEAPDHKAHDWQCNSPYCASLNDLCPDHGGLEPVRIGREPWRG